MVKRILFLLFLSVFTNMLSARELQSSYISVGGHYGSVLASNEFFEGDYAISGYTTQTLKYTMRLADDMWQKEAYGDPYYGVGIALNQFGRSEDLGDPFAIYLIQGATMYNLAKRLDLNYELNLGVITGWKPYRQESNSENVAMGLKTSVHFALDLYLKWYLSNHFDLHIGGSLFHSSNGSSQHPNKGINAANIYAELAYNFNRDLDKSSASAGVQAPSFEAHFEHDVELIVSSRNSKDLDDENTYNNEMFPIFGVGYKFMRAPSHKYRYGLGLEVLYDESSCALMYEQYSAQSKSWESVVELAPLKDRVSMGVSINGELVKPYYSAFANIGYTLYQPNELGATMYQTVGVKARFIDNIFGSFGVRAENFNKAIFLYWSLGYTLGS